MTYSPQSIEPKWQKLWQDAHVFRCTENNSKQKYYVLDMFPYPSAAGLHVGHAVGYSATDIVARFYRMKGYEVLHPMGWDAFGLPAEQHAIETGEHPEKLTFRNIDNYKLQLQRLGMSYDWSREVYTCEPDYYKWTQWIFKILYERGLAYQAKIPVNWCPALKTVLANEEVIDGKSERGGHDVVRVPMTQWMLKITEYAERLLKDLEKLDWPESVKDIQRHWIGKSTGAKIKFAVDGFPAEKITVFTTRPDTLFGATYLVLAPEHPLLDKILPPHKRAEVHAYQESAARKSDMDRTELAKDKTGVFTGAFADHPVTGKKLPIWVADYVLATYGTGAIMAVPAHDTRDFEFAQKFNLEIIPVIAGGDGLPFDGDGELKNSTFLNGLDVAQAKSKIIEWLVENGHGEATVNFKLRDWLFSRQRYWGEPIPILKDAHGNVLHAIADQELPLTLPSVKSYEPTGDGASPLAGISEWVQVKTKDGKTVFRETNTMPGTAGSSWYFLRYCDPRNPAEAFDFQKAKYWMPVDLYIGGQEHAVGHLLYSRFWTKVLFDAGVCPVDEPFRKLVNQGMICRDGAKMSKSKGNGVSPDEVVQNYGADALRVYEMFMGPVTQTKEWDESNLAGIHRFLSRVYRHFISDKDENLVNDAEPSKKDLHTLHKVIKKITHDLPLLGMNTSIAQLMILLNTFYETGCRNRQVMGSFLKLLCPFAPHLAEELYARCVLNNTKNPQAADYPFLSLAAWPEFDEGLATEDSITIGVQFNGKHKGEITIARDATQETAVAACEENPHLSAQLKEKTLVKVIFVQNRILNFVVK